MRALLVIVAVLQAAAPPAFEVASVRPNTSGPGGTSIRRLPGGSFEARNVRVRDLIMYAYSIQPVRLMGGPDWMAGDRFDIVARAGGDWPPTPPGGPAPDVPMLRALLADRFRLVLLRETRELPIYALVVARRDGRLGPQLRKSDVDCAATRCGGTGSPGGVRGTGVSMSTFPDFLAGLVQQMVVDRTGLTGRWDLELTFDQTQTDPSQPSLFTALQEQLGLRLEPTTGIVDVLVIERAERPSPD